MMVETVRFARSSDHLVKGSKINFIETIMFHWMWLEWESLLQCSRHRLAQEALSCITAWCSNRWMFLHPPMWNFRLRVWECSCMEQYFSLASQMIFLPAVYALVATSGDHLPLGIRSKPGSWIISSYKHGCCWTMPFACLARLSQSFLLISTFHVLMQGLLTASTVVEEYL